MSERHAKPGLAGSRWMRTRRIEFNKLRATCYARSGAGHGTRDLLVRAPQQNREKSIRAMFFMPQRASKSGAVGARDLTRSVRRGTVNCARGGRGLRVANNLPRQVARQLRP